ncbi:MAG: hypothetical protein AB1489_12200 [Acidobacteriota bacterium]
MKAITIKIILILILLFSARLAVAQTLEPIPDQTIIAGRTQILPIKTYANSGIAQFTLDSTLPFVRLEDGNLRVAPMLTETLGGLVTIEARFDNGAFLETSFQITILPAVIIEQVEYTRPYLNITGHGFDPNNSRVLINNKDCSRALISQQAERLILQGGTRRLNLRVGYNRIVVKSAHDEETFLVSLQAQQRGPTSIGPLIDPVQNIQAEVGRRITIDLKIQDDTTKDLTVDFKCDRGNFVTLTGNLLSVNPTIQDLGLTTCALKVTDAQGLSTNSTIFIMVVPCLLPITVNSVSDQIIKAGETRNIELRVDNPCGLPPVKISLVSAPNFVTFVDRTDGTAMLSIAPKPGDISGRVLIEVKDAINRMAQLGFNITIQLPGTIASANYSKPNLFLVGNGFGNNGVQISINNQDVTKRIKSQNDTNVTLRGNRKKLNIKSGPNLIRIVPATANAQPIEGVFEF